MRGPPTAHSSTGRPRRVRRRGARVRRAARCAHGGRARAARLTAARSRQHLHRMRIDPASAECLVYTFKEGLLSAVAHDLKIRVERFEIEVTPGEGGAPPSSV